MVGIMAAACAAVALGQAASVAEEAPRGLKVSGNRRFLVKADGSPFFYLGDTAWELFHRLRREEATHYLDVRRRQGFTVIQAVALAEFDGLQEPNPYGAVPLVGLDPRQPNAAYFEHVDFVVREANRRGLVVGFLPTWGDKVGPKAWGAGPEVFTPANARAYGEWLGRRYKDAALVWILGGDRVVDSKAREAIWDAMAAGLRAGDGGNHLITFHPQGGKTSAEPFHERPWLDFNMRQNGHAENSACWRNIAADYARKPTKPVLDAEPLYEDHPLGFNATDNGVSNAYDCRKYAYWDTFAGGFGHTYGNHCVWQFYDRGRKPVNGPPRVWQEAILAPGAEQMVHLRRLLESRPFLDRVPDPGLVRDPSAGGKRIEATRGADGGWALVYLPTSRPVTVQTKALAGERLRAWLFDPRTGMAKDLGTQAKAAEFAFSPPELGEPRDWVLALDDAARGFPPPGQPPGQPAGQTPGR